MGRVRLRRSLGLGYCALLAAAVLLPVAVVVLGAFLPAARIGLSSDELRLRDLEARRDELYRRLRSPDLNAGDRESLELAAAHTLRQLDELAPGRARKKEKKAPAAEPAETSAAPPRAARRASSMATVAIRPGRSIRRAQSRSRCSAACSAARATTTGRPGPRSPAGGRGGPGSGCGSDCRD